MWNGVSLAHDVHANVAEAAVILGPDRVENPKAFTKLLKKKTKAEGVMLQALETWDVPAAL